MKVEFPLFMVVFLPKKWQESYVQRQWDRKSNKDVLYAFKDRIGWVKWINPTTDRAELRELHKNCQRDLDERIIPQMQKRGLYRYIT